MKKLLGLVAAVGMSCLAPAIASASVINFDFASAGTLQQGSCGLGCYEIGTSGTAYDFTNDVPGTTTWTFTGSMRFLGIPGTGITDPTSPTSWSFVDDSGNNDLSGTFFWALVGGKGVSNYDITGGSGLFAGATGNGSSVISITKWYSGLPELLEVGTMHVTTPSDTTSVPEPSVTGLAAVGLAMVGFAAFRRRRVDVTRS
jgi:MYXO-CTERM domain-containing protein